MCVRTGPGLCLGPVSPSVPGPGPGYHTLIPPNSDKTETASETVMQQSEDQRVSQRGSHSEPCQGDQSQQ